MDYLQYKNREEFRTNSSKKVLNLIINGLPSIQRFTLHNEA